MMGAANDPYLVDSKRFASGTEMLKAKKNQQAFAYFDNMLKSYPKSAFLLASRGTALNRLGKLNLAIQDLNKSVDINYHGSEAYYELSEIYLSLRDYERAYANADKCVRVSRNKPDGYRIRGVAQFMSGKNEAAIADLKRAIELGDEDSQFLMQHYKLSERGY